MTTIHPLEETYAETLKAELQRLSDSALSLIPHVGVLKGTGEPVDLIQYQTNLATLASKVANMQNLLGRWEGVRIAANQDISE